MKLHALIWRRLWRLRCDQGATSLTEFAITMPVFILIMSFVYYMGVAGHVLSQETGEAQRLLWDEVMIQNQDLEEPINHTDPLQPHVHPVPGSEVDDAFLIAYTLRQKRTGLRIELHGHEEQYVGMLASGGSWGESHWRTRPIEGVFAGGTDIDHITHSPGDIVGQSPYARVLVGDTSGAQEAQLGTGGSGALAAAGAEGFASESLIPPLAAGIRYGVVHGIQDGEIEFPHGWTLPVRIHFDTIVPPTPMVHSEREVAAITRMQLEHFDPYSKLLGIQMDQNLPPEEPPAVPNFPEDD